ncbi:hypothetical protein BDW02DRAFT_51092 [Decorospora gaudefroyi]|uniref:Uncharacterized protein n=1 Tax=Decorospora gaudefroyi TaxID=184978 RepID=A0A6A5KT60_9PLEO|nr:hypothetical protein BDW02DRAFT_51092 [Decorospora gaudefroyi]
MMRRAGIPPSGQQVLFSCTTTRCLASGVFLPIYSLNDYQIASHDVTKHRFMQTHFHVFPMVPHSADRMPALCLPPLKQPLLRNRHKRQTMLKKK